MLWVVLLVELRLIMMFGIVMMEGQVGQKMLIVLIGQDVMTLLPFVPTLEVLTVYLLWGELILLGTYLMMFGTTMIQQAIVGHRQQVMLHGVQGIDL